MPDLTGVIEVDLVESRRGLPSRLAEDLAGTPVLARTVERALAAHRVRRVVVVVHRRDEERARKLLGDRPVDWFVHDRPDLPDRARLSGEASSRTCRG